MLACAFRPGGLGPATLPVILGLGIQAGSLCAGPQTPHGSLRDAGAMGRANSGLGQPEGSQWPDAAQAGLRWPAARGRCLSARAGRGFATDAGVSGTLTLLRSMRRGDSFVKTSAPQAKKSPAGMGVPAGAIA